ncbi:hypothetical protein DEF23_20120 [Marinitenerispora sediminis]|uniref:Uncharacterized protein n=1 Tax=Marinitenerispora sediminis TaxID=1931232 RepID=A0A368SYI4_9ACTN|nr:hypothetical protein DEF24_25625 [Marinitenerispora sediminis]RCV51647.1 hypothetical protein DEF23_20120 [Marinitenerispora sediminis]RCV52979.1 hypothetical protein DEF28_11645 [Marinitenerispora sediminis]
MGVAALAAAAAALDALWSLGGAADAIKVVSAWRAYGLLVFSALFTLLAARPRAYRGVWEVVIFHKLAMTLTAVVYQVRGGVADADTIIVADGILTVALVSAYVLCRGWSQRPAPPARG